MSSTTGPTKFAKADLQADSRDISVLWNKAINQYNETANQHKDTSRVVLTTPIFEDTQAMMNFGRTEMQRFHFFRNGDKKIDKLRTLFMQNIDFIEAGSKQLLTAVSASFPPALAVGTAMTFVLAAFRSQSADYDVVANFFEDMNSFLQRVSIIERRVPTKKAYQNALMDVFTALLQLCALARKYILLKRFKKWIANAFFGGDSELEGGRKQMDTSLSRLQSATEFAILDNSENLLDQQVLMADQLSDLHQELRQNEKIYERIAANQSSALELISGDIQALREDVKRLLTFQQASEPNEKQNATKTEEISSNPVRHFYGLRPEVGSLPDMLAFAASLEKSQVKETGLWLFEDPTWLSWNDWSRDTPSLLWLMGGSGIGKTYLSISVYQQLCGLRDPEAEVCTAYFSCRRSDIQRSHTEDLLRSCAIQITDQSLLLRQSLEAKWRNGRIDALLRKAYLGTDTVDHDIFIYDNFRRASQHRLYIVVDGLNEFSAEELRRFYDVVLQVQERGLQIKFVATSDAAAPKVDRPNTRHGREQMLHTPKSQTVHIRKEQILPDLMRMVWARLNSGDSAYDGLRRLERHTQQKLARRIEQEADGLLYVDQILRLLASVALEGSVDGLLNQMPVDLAALHEIILKRSQRTLSSESLQCLKSVVMWLVYSFRPVTLEWLDMLAKSAGGFSGELILSLFSQFFEVDYVLGDTTSYLPMDTATLFEASTDTPPENLQSSDSLRLKVKNRTIQIFFGSADATHDLRTSESDAHRRIFLDTVNIILKRKVSNKSLYEYAIEHSLMHWHLIVPGQHTPEEQTEVCYAFARLVQENHFAEGLLEHPRLYGIEQITSKGWKQKWWGWSSCAPGLSMSPDITNYWQDSFGAVYPLVTAFSRCWLQSTSSERAVKAFEWANSVKYWVGIDYFPQVSSDEDDARRVDCKWGVHRMAGILGVELNSHAHFAVALVLAAQEADKWSSAVQEFLLALDRCRDTALKDRCYVQLASICVRKEDWEGAVEYCRLALQSEQTMMRQNASDTGSGMQAITTRSDDGVQESIIRGVSEKDAEIAERQFVRIEILRIQGVAMKSLGMRTEAARSLCQARQLSTEVVPARYLFAELLCLEEDPVSMIDELLSFKPIDQFNLLTSDSNGLSDEVNIPPTRIILPAIVKSQRKDEVIEIYRGLIKALDAEEAGAPVKVDLARMLWQLRHEIKDAKSLLNQVLDSIAQPKRYQLTNRLPTDVAGSALLLMIDILLEEFGSSKRVDDKRQILLEAKELPRRSFLASQPLINDSVWGPYSVAVAHMLRKIGSMSEFEHVMNEIYRRAHDGLTDSTTSNDRMYLRSLSRILMMIPPLRELGESLHTKDLLRVESDVKDSRDYCRGICSPVLVFDDSNLKIAQYRCLICADSRLCKNCHDLRMQWNANPTIELSTRISFCCSYGQYIRTPMQDWCDIRDGVLYLHPLEGGSQLTSIISEQDMQDIEEKWKLGWEDLSSGI